MKTQNQHPISNSHSLHCSINRKTFKVCPLPTICNISHTYHRNVVLSQIVYSSIHYNRSVGSLQKFFMYSKQKQYSWKNIAEYYMKMTYHVSVKTVFIAQKIKKLQLYKS